MERTATATSSSTARPARMSRHGGRALSRIFISYRRQDSGLAAGRLAERLATDFSGGTIFRDLEAIEAGADFEAALEAALSSCSVLLALIGPRWLSAAAADGRHRLDDPGDLVRREIASALRRPQVWVVPVLVDGARMPVPDELPDELRELSHRQSVELSDRRWHHDVRELERTIARHLPSSSALCVHAALLAATVALCGAAFARLPRLAELGASRDAFLLVVSLLGAAAGAFLAAALGRAAPRPSRSVRAAAALAALTLAAAGGAVAVRRPLDLVVGVRPPAGEAVPHGEVGLEAARGSWKLPIPPEGQAVFRDLPGDLRFEPVRLVVNATGYTIADRGARRFPATGEWRVALEHVVSAVTGTVTSDGRLVAGARVTFEDGLVEATTDEQGHFRVDVPQPPGTLVLVTVSLAQREGYRGYHLVPCDHLDLPFHR